MRARWLTFGLSPEQEDRFRRAHLAADLTQARVSVALLLAPLVAFSLNDYGFFGPSWRFYGLTALRVAIGVHAIVLLARLRGFTSYRRYDREELVFGLSFAAFVLLVAWTRPQAFVAHAIVAVVAVFVSAIALPNRFASQLALSAIYTVGETIVISRWTLQPLVVTVLVSMWLAAGTAVAVAWQVHAWRRREFLAREGEQQAKAEAERLLAERARTEAALRGALAANERLVAELRESLDNVKTLSGMLPICMHCKNIRNDKGYWEKIERYVASRTEAHFSHGLCPDCLRKYYSAPPDEPESGA